MGRRAHRVPHGIGYGDPEREAEFDRRWPIQYHFVGKDITRFHCVIWPAMLMAAGMPITHTVFGHGFLLTKGEKMSKSKGNGLMPADLVRVFGVDAYRYYFMSDVQFGHDGSISMERMVQVYNADLANTWGNLVSRVTNMTTKYFEGRVPRRPPVPRTIRCARSPTPCTRNTTPAWPRWTSPGPRRRCRSWRAA